MYTYCFLFNYDFENQSFCVTDTVQAKSYSSALQELRNRYPDWDIYDILEVSDVSIDVVQKQYEQRMKFFNRVKKLL